MSCCSLYKSVWWNWITNCPWILWTMDSHWQHRLDLTDLLASRAASTYWENSGTADIFHLMEHKMNSCKCFKLISCQLSIQIVCSVLTGSITRWLAKRKPQYNIVILIVTLKKKKKDSIWCKTHTNARSLIQTILTTVFFRIIIRSGV